MHEVGSVLIVDSDGRNRDAVFASALKRSEIPMLCSSYGEARNLLSQCRFDVVFCSDNLPDGNYLEVINAAKPTRVIVLSRFAEWDSYVAALDAGAFDYIVCPPCPVELDRVLSHALDKSPQVTHRASAA